MLSTCQIANEKGAQLSRETRELDAFVRCATAVGRVTRPVSGQDRQLELGTIRAKFI